MPKPSINATLEALRKQSARGSEHGAAPGSASNIGGRTGIASPAAGGATAGLGANPSRVGAPRPAVGAYQKIAGSPGPTAPPTPASVRTHSLAIGGMKHLVAAGHIQPAHAKQMEAKSRAHIAAYQKMKPVGAPAAKAPRFGALGGMKAGGLGGGAMGAPPGSDNGGIPSANPGQMDY